MCSNEAHCSCAEENPIERVRQLRRAQCVKCKGSNGPPALLIRKDDPPLCRTCFMDACLHKFKSAFGKSNVISKQSEVAVAFSGGRSSMVMLHLLRQHVKRLFIPKLFHIIEPGTTQTELDRISKIMEDTDFAFSMIDPRKIHASISQLRDETRTFSDSLSVMKSLPELDTWSRQKLLAECALHLDCQFLCLGECGTHMANHFVVGLIQGRGSQAAASAHFVDRRFDDVTIIRPLFQFLSKELVFYAHFAGLQPVISQDLMTSAVLERPGATSLLRLCEDFLAELQAGGFPSTVQTILRTASKIAVLDQVDSATIKCLLCKDPIPSSSTSRTNLAIAALNKSRVLPRRDGASSSTEVQSDRQRDLEQHLCAGCRTIYEEMPSQLRPTFEKAFLESEDAILEDDRS
ncbi:unnamed protein product [Dicrocoelium dendriticum]|nr:unnamed protein product [Dicrocoelium dendriticum]